MQSNAVGRTTKAEIAVARHRYAQGYPRSRTFTVLFSRSTIDISAMRVLGRPTTSIVLLQQFVSQLDVLLFSVLLQSALQLVPCFPLVVVLHVENAGLGCVIVTYGGLLVQTVELQQFVIGGCLSQSVDCVGLLMLVFWSISPLVVLLLVAATAVPHNLGWFTAALALPPIRAFNAHTLSVNSCETIMILLN